jgi:hypothetical protein
LAGHDDSLPFISISVKCYFSTTSLCPSSPFLAPFLAAIFILVISYFLKIPSRIMKMLSEYRLARALNKVLRKMDEERNKAAFINGDLNYILDVNFPRFSKRFRGKIIRALEAEKEIEVGQFGNYIFYRGKVLSQRIN